jgi:hypothetical protein
VSNYHSLILVEGKNDKGFVESLLKICFPQLIDSIKIFDLKGINNLKSALDSNFTDFKGKEYRNLGIIIDVDNSSREDRIQLVNDVFRLQILFQNTELNTNTLSAECMINGNRNLKISLFLMSASNGKGELIDLLKEIKKRESVVSDCAIECLTKKEDSTSKELSDDWLHLYLKWDCSNSAQRKGSRNIGLDKENTKNRIEEIFDFNSENSVLNNLKTYLQQFKQQK